MFWFYTPWAALLLPLPLIFLWLFPAEQSENDEEVLLAFPWTDRLQKAFSGQGSQTILQQPYFLGLLTLAWGSLVFAMMQPELVDQIKSEKTRGFDILVAVDTSLSMMALDFSSERETISRLDAAKEVVGTFVQGRKGDRVGLITFGERPYLHVPLTLDTATVSRMLADISTGMAGNATSLGDAIALAVKTLKNRPEGSRILVLLTDGEDNSSRIPPLQAAKLAASFDIRIHTVGIGKKGLVPFPSRFGGVQMAQVSIDEDLLRTIAATASGSYFYAEDKTALQQIYKTIDRMEKTEAEEEQFYIREPLYRYPLGVAMIAIAGLAFFPLVRRSAYA